MLGDNTVAMGILGIWLRGHYIGIHLVWIWRDILRGSQPILYMFQVIASRLVLKLLPGILLLTEPMRTVPGQEV